MDHIELWDKAKALMREELANVSYTTWIEQPLKPVYVVDDKLALEVISDFNEKTIRARYLPMITEAVSQAAGREMTIELMSVKERIEWQERQKKEDAPAMQGINMFNPKSTFDTFVVGSSIASRTPPRWPSPSSRAWPITRCSSTAASVWERRT